MQKFLLVLIFLCGFLIISCHRNQTIRINTLTGLEVDVPANCSIVTDNCTVYCRIGINCYKEVQREERRCIQANIIYPKCDEDNPDSVIKCEDALQGTSETECE